MPPSIIWHGRRSDELRQCATLREALASGIKPAFRSFWWICQKEPRQRGKITRKILCKMFLLFPETLLDIGFDVEIGKIRLFVINRLVLRFLTTSLRRRIVLE